MLWKLGKLSFVRSLIPFFIATLSFPSVFMQSKEVSHIILLNKRKKCKLPYLSAIGAKMIFSVSLLKQ